MYATCTQIGANCAVDPSSNSYPFIGQDITNVIPGATYSISLWARFLAIYGKVVETDPAAGCSLYAYLQVDTFISVPIVSFYAPSATWAQYQASFTVPTSAASNGIYLFSIMLGCGDEYDSALISGEAVVDQIALELIS